MRVTMEWGWDEEAQDLLSHVDAPSEETKVALATLYRRFAAQQNLKGLWQASERMAKFNPENDQIRNNFAMYSLILNRSTSDASLIAKELYERHRSDPTFISTYAFSLVIAENPKLALKVMSTMSSAQLARPEMAAYYALTLAANWQNEQALKFFDLAKNGHFLPEEAELIANARIQTRARFLLPYVFLNAKAIFDAALLRNKNG